MHAKLKNRIRIKKYFISTKQCVLILKNNKVEAVVISKDEYEQMKEALKQIEAKNILSSVQAGLKDLKEGKTHSIDSLWEEL